MFEQDVSNKVEELYLSWKERVGEYRANLMLGALAMSMAISDRGVSDELVADALEEALLHILGIDPEEWKELSGNRTVH